VVLDKGALDARVVGTLPHSGQARSDERLWREYPQFMHSACLRRYLGIRTCRRQCRNGSIKETGMRDHAGVTSCQSWANVARSGASGSLNVAIENPRWSKIGFPTVGYAKAPPVDQPITGPFDGVRPAGVVRLCVCSSSSLNPPRAEVKLMFQPARIFGESIQPVPTCTKSQTTMPRAQRKHASSNARIERSEPYKGLRLAARRNARIIVTRKITPAPNQPHPMNQKRSMILPSKGTIKGGFLLVGRLRKCLRSGERGLAEL